MKVFKFGGASIESVERARNVVSILADYSKEQLVVVISAKGKTTNALEAIVQSNFAGNTDEAIKLTKDLEQEHIKYAKELLRTDTHDVFDKIKELFTEIYWTLDEPKGRDYDYYYDQIVSVGELLSTAIIAAYMNLNNIACAWLDVRDVMKTDATYRDAVVDMEQTAKLISAQVANLFDKVKLIVTQGFIGSTDENNSVTLGREGSDYTAAIFANSLDAESVTIWKDVPSLLTADPKIFPNTVAIPAISFREVIEMSYYGAQVIHPKTIKPLHNKQIPLYVKCFLDKSLPGTKIYQAETAISYPPIMVLKQQQVLLQVTTKDFSFITEDNLSKIYNLFHECKIKINLIQNAAISFVACIDNQPLKIARVLEALSHEYDVKRNENLFLFTVRHYRQSVLKEELKDRTVLLTQKTRQTIQLVVR